MAQIFKIYSVMDFKGTFKSWKDWLEQVTEACSMGLGAYKKQSHHLLALSILQSLLTLNSSSLLSQDRAHQVGLQLAHEAV